MTKLGDEYQEIVGLVRSSLDPAAIVKVGQWVEGPDGRRDIDVEVRGQINELNQFILIECKDWRRPVGIEVIDALESKRHDLEADLAVIYSNSGFTEPALRKARRVGIQAFSALKDGDNRIRITIAEELIVKALSVDSYSLLFYLRPEMACLVPEQWMPLDVIISGLPFVNWLHNESLELLQTVESNKKIIAIYEFIQEQQLTICDKAISVIGFELLLFCRMRWLSQEVQTGVTLGHYDHLKKKIVIPNLESYLFGPVDQDKWQEIHHGWSENQLEPNSFILQMTLFRPIAQIANGGFPSLCDLLTRKETSYEDLEFI